MTKPLKQSSLNMSDRKFNDETAHELTRAAGIRSGSVKSRLRVLIVAPSLDILGGQAVQAARLMTRLHDEPSLEIGFLPINPRLPGLAKIAGDQIRAHGRDFDMVRGNAAGSRAQV